MDQLSSWDWMPDACPVPEPKQICETWHPLIKSLAKEVFMIFRDEESGDDSYEVWDHVPNLGKRYEVWFYGVEEFDFDKFQKLQQAYKEEKLEVTINVAPSTKKKGTYNYMITSMWLTKGHKEP